MRGKRTAMVWLFGVLLLAACAAPAPPPPPDAAPLSHTVRVISNGWHTAIVIERAELTASALVPEADDFSAAQFVEFGWGDRVYYPAKEKSLGMTLDAALTPTPSIMHMAGLARPPELGDGDRDMIAVALSHSGLQQLIGAIADTFERPAGGRATAVSRGFYPDSFFYNARGSFHLFNTCNTWTARILRAGGVDVSPAGVSTADELMERLRAARTLDRR